MSDKTVVVRIVVRANQFSSGLKGAAGQTQKFAVDVERASERAGSSALALGAAAATAGKLMLVGIGGALAVSAKAAIDFESSMAGVAKTTDLAGTSFAKAGSPLAAFGESLRALSMRIPLNVNELARIAELGGQLGIQVPNLVGFTEAMAALGVSTNLNAEQAATGLARFVNIMGTEQDQFERLGSIVVELGNNLATTESEILNFALRLAPVGRVVGMTEDEVFGLAGALTSLGIPAERGGTALQRFFIDFQQAAEAGGESAENFARVAGMSVEELQTLFDESPSQAFVAILQGLDDLQERGGNAAGALADLGVIQQRSIQVLLAAAGGWETVSDAIGMASDESERGTALQEEAARRYGTTASQIQLVGNAFNDLRIEIGNALLGSGGLAAGIDFLREFVRIIKDNLPMIGRLAAAIALISTMRIGAGIVESAAAAINGLRGMKVGIDGVTRASKFMRIGMLGLNTAVFGAIGIAGLLITKWALAAAKAAELRREAKQLQEQIDQGQDPVQAMIDLLDQSNVLTDKRKDLLLDAGISEERFASALLNGGDAASELRAELEESIGMTDRMREAMRTGFTVEGQRFAGLPPQMMSDMREIDELFSGGSERGTAFLENRILDIRNAFVEAGLGAEFTTEQLESMARSAVGMFDFDVPVGSIWDLLNAPDALARRMDMLSGDFIGANEATSLSWREMVQMGEDGSERIVDFLDMAADGVGDYRNTLVDSFEDVKQSILGQFPTWDEYEKQTEVSFQAALDSQQAYLEDLRDGFELEEALTGEVSENVLNFIRGLDPGFKAALGRWRETNETEFNAWVEQVGENLDEAGVSVGDFWSLRLPEEQRQGMATMLLGIVEEAKKFNLPGKQTADAIFDGLRTQMVFLSDTEKDAMLGMVEDMFMDEAFLKSIGVDIGNPIVLGILQALGGLSSRGEHVVRREIAELKGKFNKELIAESPSKLFMEVGRTIPQGLFAGMEDEFGKQLNMAPAPINNIFTPQPVVNVRTEVAGGSRDIHIHNPQHKDDDIFEGIRKANFLNTLTLEAESTPGSQ